MGLSPTTNTKIHRAKTARPSTTSVLHRTKPSCLSADLQGGEHAVSSHVPNNRTPPECDGVSASVIVVRWDCAPAHTSLKQKFLSSLCDALWSDVAHLARVAQDHLGPLAEETDDAGHTDTPSL